MQNPGGGGALPYWRWRGRAAGQGMIFTVIHIGTGYLNRPNWLLAGYSVYHRVASRASHLVPSPQCLWQAHDLGTSDGACGTTMFMTGPRSRHQRRCVRDHNVYDRHAISAPATVRAGPQCLWQARDLGTSNGACGTTMFMTDTRSRHQRRCVRDHNVYDRPAISAPATVRAGPQCLWQARDLGTSDGACGSTMFMTGTRSRHQQRCVRDHNVYDKHAISAPATARAGRNRFLWMYDATQQNRESVRTGTGYAYESFSKLYCDGVYFFCAPSGLRQGQVFDPPAAPPPPPGAEHVHLFLSISLLGKNWIYENLVSKPCMNDQTRRQYFIYKVIYINNDNNNNNDSVRTGPGYAYGKSLVSPYCDRGVFFCAAERFETAPDRRCSIPFKCWTPNPPRVAATCSPFFTSFGMTRPELNLWKPCHVNLPWLMRPDGSTLYEPTVVYIRRGNQCDHVDHDYYTYTI